MRRDISLLYFKRKYRLFKTISISFLAFVVMIYAKFWSNQYKRNCVGVGLHWVNLGLENYRETFYESVQQTQFKFAIQMSCEDMLKNMHE